jgi:hypothetical protein
MTEPGLLDVVVTHAKVMGDLVQHRIGHLIDEFRMGLAPVFNMALEQHDPLRIFIRAEGRIGIPLVESQDVLVDVVVAIVIGRHRLDGDHQVVGIHARAQRCLDTVQSDADDALELGGGNVKRHLPSMTPTTGEAASRPVIRWRGYSVLRKVREYPRPGRLTRSQGISNRARIFLTRMT